jgi:tetratricopeptide (TPR) repeat protein
VVFKNEVKKIMGGTYIVRILVMVFFLIFSAFICPFATQADDIDLRTREREFYQKALDAIKKNDESALAALVAEYEPVVFNAIMTAVTRSIRGIADGGSQGQYYSEIAKTLAREYAKQFNKKDLVHLVEHYSSYSREEARARMQAEVFWRDALSLTRGRRWEDAQKPIIEALTMYRALGDKTREADSLGLLGVIYKNLGKEKECLRSNEEALHIMQILGNVQGERTMLHNTGIALSQFGNHKEAIPYYQKSLAISRRISDSSHELITLKALGLAYDKLNENREALAIYELAVKVAKDRGNKLEEGRVLLRMGVIHHELRQYKEAIAILQQALAIFQEIKDFREQYTAFWHLGYIHWRMNENERSYEYYLKGLQVAIVSGDERLQAGALRSLGEIYERTSKYNEAKEYYLKALALYQKNGDIGNEAKTLSEIGNILIHLGRYQESLDFFLKASEKAEGLNDAALKLKNLLGFGRTYYYLREYGLATENLLKAAELTGERNILELANIDELLGMIALSNGLLTDAVRAFESSLKSYQISKLPQDEVRILTSLGRLYGRLGQNEKALEYFRKSAEISRTSGDAKGEAGALLEIGSFMGRIGKYAESLDYLTQSLSIANKSGNPVDILSAHYQIGSIYLNIGNSNKARDHYEQALHIARETGDKGKEGEVLLEIATIIYYYEGNLIEGLRVIREVLDKVPSDDLSITTKAAHHLGFIFMKTGQYEEALENYQAVLKNYQRLNDVPNEPMALLNIGIAYYNLGRFDDATRELNASLQLARQINQLEDIWWAEAILGKTLRRAGKPEEAVAHYKKAVEAIEEIYVYTKGLTEEERSAMLGGKIFVYKEYIELLLDLHKNYPIKGYDREAFIISEKAKSRTFQELMTKAGAQIVFSGDESFKKLIAKEQQWIGEITHLRSLLTQELSRSEKERNKEAAESIRGQLGKAEKSLIDLGKEIESKYPRYADLRRPEPLCVEELQTILKPDETVISYAVGKDKIAAFVIGEKSFKLIEMDIKREELSKFIRRFRRGLEDVTEIKDLEKFKPDVAYELYQKIFNPLSLELKGITKLYISGDDILYTLPFEALVDKAINEKAFNEARERGGVYLSEYSTLHYLVDTYAFTYLPSVSVLRSLRKYEKPGYGKWNKPLIAFADPIFSEEERKEEAKVKGNDLKPKGVSQETALSLQILTRSTGGEKLERLKESAQEAEAISKELKSKKEDIYLREKATEENVYRTNLKDSRYILFSTHGLLGGDFTGVAEPALALTLVDNPPGRDGFLTMSEVLGLDLNSELIILSACNTSGKGDKPGSGEGFVGLTRSFMYAGGKSLLVTHWSVESQAARDLMVGSMELMKTKAKPEALREAKLKMKDSVRTQKDGRLSLSHPFFWAPFVLVGEGK